MIKSYCLPGFFVFLLILTACVSKTLPPVHFTPPLEEIDYLKEVKPVLDKRCVVCHSCYNSPCQLKLSSFEGLDRGASMKAVYNAQRTETMDPTRLFIDAQSTEEWRGKGFHSVTDSTTYDNQNDSIMMQLLHHKVGKPVEHGDSFMPEEDELTCADTGETLGAYLKKHPNRGMPYGFPPLPEKEFNIVAGWLVQGAQKPTDEQMAEIKKIPPQDRIKIEKWEKFFNEKNPKHMLTARYLYEHLFLAHIKFDTNSGSFYQLRRYTVDRKGKTTLVATTRPYDDPPDEGCLMYRFEKIHSTIVHKTHMVFELSDVQFNRFNELFIDVQWFEPSASPADDDFRKINTDVNPFHVFEQIPVRSRYLFLLDHIHYILMTFIRGPVCKGQVALNVIRDHFWLIFLDPEYDLSIKDHSFLAANKKLLEMPTEKESTLALTLTLLARKHSIMYSKQTTKYIKSRNEFYAKHYGNNLLDHKAIWNGKREGPGGKLTPGTPLLTVFRHFDSASVHKGALGNLPRTILLMDYPLVERIYYALVAGFNVFGKRTHQASRRIYMDELRQEGETYFLNFMPYVKRKEMMQSWYGEMDINRQSIEYSPSGLETGIDFTTQDYKREFLEYLVNNHFVAGSKITFDENYLKKDGQPPVFPTEFANPTHYIKGFRAVSKPGTSFFAHVNDHDANLAYVRIIVDKNNEEKDIYLSMIVNRWHHDVTTLYGEDERLDPARDTATFIKGFIGSYPNYFFEVNAKELPDFLKVLRDYNGDKQSIKDLSKFGVNRANGNFWEVYDRFQDRFLKSDKVHAGLFDLNRYYHKAYKVEDL